MNVHEFRQVLWVTTPLGDGIALLHLDYGAQHNGTLLVMLESGQFKYFDTNQVTACRNDTCGVNVPRVPRRVVALRSIGVLCLMGRAGTVVQEGDPLIVLFDGDQKPQECASKDVANVTAPLAGTR